MGNDAWRIEWNYQIKKKETYKYLRSEHQQTSGNERKYFSKKYLRRTRNLLETKQYSRIFIRKINIWAILLGRYSGEFLKWTRKLKQMDQLTRKLKALRHMSREKKEEEDLPGFKIALMYRYNHSMALHRKCRRKGITVTRDDVDNKIINRNSHNYSKRRSKTVWTFPATNKWHLTWENLDMAKKWKPWEINWISSNSSTKQHHKDQLY